MLNLIEQISQKLPHASESLLQEIWMMLSATDRQKLSESVTKNSPNHHNFLSSDAPYDEGLSDEFERWEAASDEDSDRIEEMSIAKGG